MARACVLVGISLLASACSNGSATNSVPPTDAGPTGDAGARDSSPPSADASDVVDAVAPDGNDDAATDGAMEGGDASASILGSMGLFQLAGTVSSDDAGPVSAVVLEALVSFHAPLTHAFDGRSGGTGCFADHYDATTNPAPVDRDAGLLRVSGYAGGASIAHGSIGQPISCARGASGFYVCDFPNGAPTDSVLFPAAAAPLGAATISFGTNGGGDFGAAGASASAAGTVAVTEDLTTIDYSATADATLDLTCTGCAASTIGVRLEAFPSTDEAAGWPYSSVGVVDCVFPEAAQVTIPKAAIAAMLGSDTALDAVRTSVTALPSSPGRATDPSGNPLDVEVGVGVFGVAHL